MVRGEYLMSDDSAIKVHHLDKSFDLSGNKSRTVKQLVVNIGKKHRSDRQLVLKNIDFEIKKGDFFGIVGRNGSGKSTLLKLIAGVYTPDSGAVELNGSLTPFIELGVGFNPELTGKDNVYLNAALLGYTRKQTIEIYDEIVQFAELGEHMDKKLKNYSSGMQVRLAFSIAIKVKSDILIFDEVLAVGDEAFQRKCFDVFEKYKAQKQTVVLVTHDMETVRRFCNRALILDKGSVLDIGDPSKVAASYSKLNLKETEREISGMDRNSKENDLLLNIAYSDNKGIASNSFKCGDKIRVLLNYQNKLNYKHLVINIYKQSGEHITGFRIPSNSSSAVVDIVALMSKGRYYVLVQAINSKDQAVGDVVVGNDFIITTDRPPGVPGWSGLVPVQYSVIKH